MKKITSLLSTVFISSMHLFSQPTITSSILPSVGVEITHNIYDAKNFSPGAIGASVTWDFSQMTKGQVSTFSYVDPSTVVGSSAYPN
ncbi:MAG TPA: hypothetical protein DCX54_00880, partial [Flavobacteriales bacterium]|nr:hypothetical protein [Flavobacteriales bacterium]